MSRYRSYGALDDQPAIQGDTHFKGFGSYRDPAMVPEGFLFESENLRMEEMVAEVRKGAKRLTSNATILGATIYASTEYRDPETGKDYIVLFSGSAAYFWRVADGNVITVSYGGGQTLSAPAYAMTAFNSIYVWRSEATQLPAVLPITLGNVPLVFNGAGLEGGTATIVAATVDSTSELKNFPPGGFGAFTQTRLLVHVGGSNIRASNILKPNVWSETHQSNIDPDGIDAITAIVPLEGDAALIGKRRSLHVISGIQNFSELAASKITDQVGCVHQRTAKRAGQFVFLLGDGGVYSLDLGARAAGSVGTPIAHLKVKDEPLSFDIQDEIENINFTTAAGETSGIAPACAVVVDNRYFLAVPTTASGNDRILVFNIALNAWETVDTLPSGVIVENLIKVHYQNRLRPVAITNSGKMLLLDENANGLDEYGNSGSATTAAVAPKAVTRLYNENIAEITTWKRASVSMKAVSGGSDTMRVQASTREPDSAASELSTFSKTNEETLQRMGVSKRGYGIQFTLDAGSSPSGRWQLRNLRVEGRVANRRREGVD